MGTSGIACSSLWRGEGVSLVLSPCCGDLHCYRWGPTKCTHDSREPLSSSLPSNMAEISFVVAHIASDLCMTALSATRFGAWKEYSALKLTHQFSKLNLSQGPSQKISQTTSCCTFHEGRDNGAESCKHFWLKEVWWCQGTREAALL